MMNGLTLREDGVLQWNGVAIEVRNVVWDGRPVACVAARFDPVYGPTWRVDHATGDLAAKIMALSANDHRLERMWALSDEDPDPPRR